VRGLPTLSTNKYDNRKCARQYQASLQEYQNFRRINIHGKEKANLNPQQQQEQPSIAEKFHTLMQIREMQVALEELQVLSKIEHRTQMMFG